MIIPIECQLRHAFAGTWRNTAVYVCVHNEFMTACPLFRCNIFLTLYTYIHSPFNIY